MKKEQGKTAPFSALEYTIHRTNERSEPTCPCALMAQ